MHPLVVGELACGNLHRRQVTLSLLDSLLIAKVASDYEARCQIETMRLFGAGMGFADVHLLSSCQLSGCLLWTKDRALIAVAEKSGIAYMPPI